MSKVRRITTMAAIFGLLSLAASLPAAARTSTSTKTTTTSTTAPGFSYGELGSNGTGLPATTSGCGFNNAGEPSAHVSKGNQVLVGSERGVGDGTDAWVRDNLTSPPQGPVGGAGASACSLYYDGQPNGVAGVGAAGGDVDTAFGSAPEPVTGFYPMYVASLNLGSVAVAHSLDNGTTWQNTPVQAGLPGDDREWIAAYGLNTSLLTYHDIASSEIDVLRSDNAGAAYTQISQAIPLTGPYAYTADDNQHGNLVIDHNNPGTVPAPVGFRAYQSFVAPSSAPSTSKNLGCLAPSLFVCTIHNEAFVSVSTDGGFTWTVKPVPCSVGNQDLGNQFPNVSVAPNGNLWETWAAGSQDSNGNITGGAVYAAVSPDQGNSWTCAKVGSGIMPWLVAGASGEDLVFYGASGSTWSVMFAQNTSTTSPSGFKTTSVVPVHSGPVCGSGAGCSGSRQLFDDFAVDTDQSGWAHIAYSHDCSGPLLGAFGPVLCSSPPSQLGGPNSYTGYAVQTAGTTIGAPN
ncbi:MAG: hypothetical protein ABR573_06755 [Candidatus Dormibacteria bacterium]